MEMEITFPGGARVDANFGGMTVKTDQPVQGGGQGSAPDTLCDFSRVDWHVRGHLRAGLLPAARHSDRWHQDRAAYAVRSDDGTGRPDRSGDSTSARLSGEI